MWFGCVYAYAEMHKPRIRHAEQHTGSCSFSPLRFSSQISLFSILIRPKDGRWVKRAGLRGQTARHTPSVSVLYRCAPPGIFAAAPRCPLSATIPAALPDSTQALASASDSLGRPLAAVRGPTHSARRALNNRHRHQTVTRPAAHLPALTRPGDRRSLYSVISESSSRS